jgi:hypothetical protein
MKGDDESPELRRGARSEALVSDSIYGVRVEGGDLVIRGNTGELTRWRLPAPTR